jgi:polycystin 1L2
MRQLRLRLSLLNITFVFEVCFLKIDTSCKVPRIMRSLINSCKGSYSTFSDERRSFAPGWVISTNETYSSSIRNSFIYRSSAELDSYIYVGDYGTYGGGGYVYEFHGDLNDLQDNLTVLRQLTWIDEESRAIMIQMNLYNPNVKLFTSVTLLIEISDTGEVFPSARIEPMQMYNEFKNFSSIFYLIIAFIYILFITYFTFVEIYGVFKLKKKYFRQLRPYIEWGIIGCSWGGVGVYVWRYHEVNRIGEYFRETNGSQYINLQLAAYVNDILTYILGFCCFFGTIRLLSLFDIYPRINIFSRTFHRAFKDIASFTFMFLLLFSGFVILFYLLFVSKMRSCSSILQTSGMLFQMLLLEFDFNGIRNADAFLGPFVFALFIYFCVFICFTMFIVIILKHFRYVRTEMQKTGNTQPDILTFIIRDIAKRIG